MKADKLKDTYAPDDGGLDIIMDAKEPFSMRGFFEEQVVERAKRFRQLLSDRGILFFLTSPFQARSRLIAQMLILCIGVMFGVVPRASSMITELQDQAYASEIAGLTRKSVGSLSITPVASSNYKKLHMLAFVVEGRNLPSDASKYEVHLARGYGASDWADVYYSWAVYPANDTQRILLVAIDQSGQASGYGAFQLYIQLAGDEVPAYAKAPFEVTLSTAQDTTGLYDKNGVHLSALTEAICGRGGISARQAEFEEALAVYQTVLEQAEGMPVPITVSPTAGELSDWCLANRIYRTLTDSSDTEDIIGMAQAGSTGSIAYDAVLTSDGIRYDAGFVKELRESGAYSDEDGLIFSAFDKVDNAKKAVTAAMDNVNAAAAAWYDKLSSYKLVLNRPVDPSTFTVRARCKDTIDGPIAFVGGGTEGSVSGGDMGAGTESGGMDGMGSVSGNGMAAPGGTVPQPPADSG